MGGMDGSNDLVKPGLGACLTPSRSPPEADGVAAWTRPTAIVAAVMMVLSCAEPASRLSDSTGRTAAVEARLSWSTPLADRPAPGSVWIHASVSRTDGRAVDRRVIEWSSQSSIIFDELPGAIGLRVVVQLRTGPEATARACCSGRSQSFDLTSGQRSSVEVRLQVEPTLVIDGSLVSWIRAPRGRSSEERLTPDFAIPKGPYFGVGPTEPWAPTAVVASDAFELVGDIAPSSLQFLAEDGRLLAETTPDRNGDWPRSEMNLGTTDPRRVIVRGALSNGRRSEPVPLSKTWLIDTSAEPSEGTTGASEVRGVVTATAPTRSGRLLSRSRTGAPDGSTAAALLDVAWEERELGRPPPRTDHALAHDPTEGRVLLFGGNGNPAVYLEDLWSWDGRAWIRHPSPEGPSARGAHAMAFDEARRELVLFGGFDYQLETRGDTWTWDGEEWVEHDLPESPPARRHHALVYDRHRQRVVLFGGEDPNDSLLGDTWEWDGRAWRASMPASPPAARANHALAFDDRQGRVVLFGGTNGGPLRDTWTWDGQTWSEQTSAGGPSARWGHAMTHDDDLRQVILHGGRTTAADGSDHLFDTWTWDGQAWREPITPSRPPARGDHAMARAREGIILFGGSGVDGVSLQDTWEWTDGSWSEAEPVWPPDPRREAALVFDRARDQTVLFGGCSRTRVEDMWTWDGQTWFEQDPADLPPETCHHAMAYDAANEEVVLFDGVDGTTWTYSGTTWTQRFPDSSPAPRGGHALTYDADRRQVLLFGGSHPRDPPFEDTWTWDGHGWARQSVETSPPGRGRHALAFDADRGRVVLFGGFGEDGHRFRDTWEWDGSTWTKREPPRSPPAMTNLALVHDTLRQRIVLFGAGGPTPQTTWEWDGQTWTQDRSMPVPSSKFAHAMTYDETNRHTIVFGGVDRYNRTLGETWVRGGGLAPAVQFTSMPLPSEGARFSQVSARAHCAFAEPDDGHIELELWSGGRWLPLGASHPGGSSDPEATLIAGSVSGPDAASAAASGRLVLRCRSSSRASRGLHLDYFEMAVLYEE